MISCSAAHPRSRGENGTAGTRQCRRGGSSPLTRGKPHRRHHADAAARLIPAHAGKTRQTRQTSSRTPAHPRSRGENVVGVGAGVGVGGSSPLTRGKPSSGHSWPASRPAHPRSRGENLEQSTGAIEAVGSSPLTRGKHGERRLTDAGTRLIPAHAGKTARYV